MTMDWLSAAFLVVTALSAAALGSAVIIFADRHLQKAPVGFFKEPASATVFLFDGEVLIDSTASARALLAASQMRGSALVRLKSCLAVHFCDLDEQLLRLPHEGVLTLASSAVSGPPLLLQAELHGGLTRLVLIDPEQHDQMPGQDMLAQRAMVEELDLLRSTMTKAPILIWREAENGDVTWANAAYLLRTGDVLEPGQDLRWPLPRLFDRTASAQGVTGQRQRLNLNTGKTLWYDLDSSAEGAGRLLFATPADSAVQAETTMRGFMQTLTDTFAHLHVGLAIFDRKRQLQLFNPALLDLTGLPADFLSMRPSLLSLLDGMRDRNRIPEPKDYRGWRQQIVDMEEAAATGLYEETWSLPGGQTYRVIGRPHPNGALALMIEDISDEMLRTRRYRADLELGQSVINEVEEAIAVFSHAGQLVMSNSAYSSLWGSDPSSTLGDASLHALCTEWRNSCAPSKIWSELEDFASNPGDRAVWRAEARLLDGRSIECRFAPLAGSATLTAFRLNDIGGKPASIRDDDERRSA
ncbi:MAG: PAS-domain containing protein [Paracoccaceae bacterium]